MSALVPHIPIPRVQFAGYPARAHQNQQGYQNQPIVSMRSLTICHRASKRCPVHCRSNSGGMRTQKTLVGATTVIPSAAAAAATMAPVLAPVSEQAVSGHPLQSLDGAAYASLSDITSVEGAAVLPYYYSTPAGRLYSCGSLVCELPELEHLGISLEAGRITLGRDHYAALLLQVLLGQLERRHVGSWLLEAAAKPGAAPLFESHPQLQRWLHHLAEQKYGKHNYLFVQSSQHAAREAADWLQGLSRSFNRELHSINVAFKHDTPRSASHLLFHWLLQQPDYLGCAVHSVTTSTSPYDSATSQAPPTATVTASPSGPCPSDNPLGAAAAAHASSHGPSTFSSDSADIAMSGAEGGDGSRQLAYLQAVVQQLPGRPKFLIKQVDGLQQMPLLAAAPAEASATPRANDGSTGCQPTTDLSRRAGACAVAAGVVNGVPVVLAGEQVLHKEPGLAAFQLVLAAQQGLQLNARECEAALLRAVSTVHAAA